MVRHKGVRLALAAVTAVLALAACSSSKKSSSASSTTTTTSLSASASTTTTKATPSFVAPASVPNVVNVRKDVTLATCAAATGGWSAGGTIKNSQGHDATYKITIFFTSTGATDLASATTSVAVAAGQSKPWSAKATFSAPSSVLCVLRGVATS